jgi:hypothetical protein
MTIKAQEVAFVKTTGEPVIVLEYPLVNRSLNSTSDTVRVRRPVNGKHGISHNVDYFESFELESLDEQRKRFISEREEMVRKFGPTNEHIPSENTGFSA